MSDTTGFNEEKRENIQEFFERFFKDEKRFLNWLRSETDTDNGVSFEDVIQDGNLSFSKKLFENS